jgi:tryptophan-rich sensory protein
MSIATRVKERIEERTGAVPRWRWYHGVAFYVLVQALTFGLSGLTSVVSGNRGKNLREDFFGDVDYFRELKQSVFSPPSWVFAPAWTINNISVIIGAWHVLNMPKNTTGRNTFLALQGASWLNYTIFNAAYFSLRSPINAFVLTLSMFVLTIASGFVALFRLRDTWVALSLATLFTWLLVALTAGTFQAAWNYDDLYHVGPFFQVNQKLLKQDVK